MDPKPTDTSKSYENKIDHYPDGKVKCIRSGVFDSYYKDQLKHGIEVSFFNSGSIISIKNYTAGRLVCRCLEFYETGQLKTEIFYDNGTINSSVVYYENGNKKYERRASVWVDSKGNNCYVPEYEFDIVEYYESGAVKKQGGYSWHYDDAEPSGRWRRFHENGAPMEICHFISGIKAGSQWLYDARGILVRLNIYDYEEGSPENVSYYRYPFNEGEWSFRIAVSYEYCNNVLMKKIVHKESGEQIVTLLNQKGK